MSDNNGAPGGTNNSQFHDQPGSFPQAYPPTGNYPPGGGYPPAGNYPPGGYPPTGDYPPGGYPPYGQPPSKGKGPLIAWIVLGVILLIAIVVGILFATGVLSSSDEQEPSSTTVEQSVEPSDESDDPVPAPGEPARYGDSAELDALWDSCEAGSLADCDELYYVSGFDTEYEEFGNTCGGTTDAAYGTCSSESDESALSYLSLIHI